MSANQIAENYEFNKTLVSTQAKKTDLLEQPLEINRNRVNQHLVSLLDPNCLEAEYYRRLRHIVECIPKSGPHKGTVVAICSPGAGDGKTVTAINVAGAIAQNKDVKVLLVELDLRKPFVTIKNYLGLDKLTGLGLEEALLSTGGQTGKDIPWGKMVRYISSFNLYFLPSGNTGSVPYELLKPPRLGDLLEAARKRYDYIVIDTPPVVFLPDSQLIEKWVDGVFLVVAAGRTPKKMLEEALNLMDMEKIIGIVFNGYTPDSIKKYGDAYAYVRVRSGLKRGNLWARLVRKYFTAW